MRDRSRHTYSLRHSRNQRGSSLLFAMLIMTVMIALGFALAALLLREIDVARSFDTGLQAYYAAESGMERSLDILQDGRINQDTLAVTVSNIEAYATSSSPFSLSSSNANYYIDASKTTVGVNDYETFIPLYFGSQVEMYNPDLPVTSTQTVESVEIQWNEGSCTNGRVEMSFSEYSGTTFDETVFKVVGDCSTAGSGYDCMLRSDYPSSGKNYVLRLRTLDCTVAGVTVDFYDADGGSGGAGALQTIPSIAQMSIVGERAQTQRVMTAQSKWIPSASGLTDFVFFSEGAFSK